MRGGGSGQGGRVRGKRSKAIFGRHGMSEIGRSSSERNETGSGYSELRTDYMAWLE